VSRDLDPASALAVPAWTARVPGTWLATVRIPGAAGFSSADLTAAVAAAYGAVLTGSRYPVRFWNFLPGINQPLDERQTRYMAFNAGRLAAFDDRPAARAATASAVGHAGRDLWVHCLAADRPPGPVDNPLQTRPHRYSARYGPRPPCFARAARLDRLLMIGGTASISGEDTDHADDLPGQVRLTRRNLSAVVAQVYEPPDRLTLLSHVRVYHRTDVDRDALGDLLQEWLPGAPELIEADMCRPELMIEIEAIAEIPA
jgi:chorismate lyase/3-hydroxybenzoate synthase